jgi:tetratricopeptide (TPR) repeat protein
MPAISSAPDSNKSPVVAPSDVLRQLERILAHPLFQKSQRLSTFLRYAVETTLAGGADSLKEFVIGAEVFERGDSFDPHTDNVVRVNASRLRSKLAEYYHHSGQLDPVVIDLPRGGYVPVFWSSLPIRQDARSAFKRSAAVKTSVGRQHELDRIRTAFASASGGTGVMVTVSGDAGMGKTTIVEDFLSEIETGKPASWIARGRCSERLAKTDAFVSIFECLDELTRGELGVEAGQLMKTTAPAWLSQVAPGREDLAGMPAGEASPERMRREFVRFFEALSAIRPVIVFLDDLHWADASTCDLLAYLGSRMKGIRILIVATYRPSELFGTHPFLSVRLALERRGSCQDILLGFLTLGDIECYLNRRFPANRFPREFANVVHERTEGNPLFMRDMLSLLVDKQILVDQEEHWQLNRDAAEIRKVIPAGIQSMIRLQMGQFSDVDRSILQCAAVQGVEFDSAVISRALSIDPGEVEDRLQGLERVHRFVHSLVEREFLDRTFSIRYRFVHVFYQNSLYADLAPTRRAAHSLAVAQSLVSLTGGTGRAIAAEVALLFESGRDNERASQYFLRAARYAAGVFAYPEAVILCERGLSALLSLPESRERDSRELELLLTLGVAQMASRGYAAPEVERTYRRSRELCLRLNEKRHLIGVLWGVHTCLVNAGELIPALELSREMRQVADALADPAAIIESLHALGTTLAFMGHLVDAREALARIFSLSPAGQHKFGGSLYVLDICVTSASMLARVLARMGLLDEALERAVTSLDFANHLAHPPSLAYATFWVGWIRHARGEHSEACSHLEAAMALSRTHGLPQILEWGRVVRGSSLTHLGRVAEGISEIRKSLDKQLAMRCLLERPYCLTLLAEALLLVNGYQEALALCDEALEIARQTQGRSYETETHRVREEILLAINHPARSGAIC